MEKESQEFKRIHQGEAGKEPAKYGAKVNQQSTPSGLQKRNAPSGWPDSKKHRRE